jgi:hypothetical protein
MQKSTTKQGEHSNWLLIDCPPKRWKALSQSPALTTNNAMQSRVCTSQLSCPRWESIRKLQEQSDQDPQDTVAWQSPKCATTKGQEQTSWWLDTYEKTTQSGTQSATHSMPSRSTPEPHGQYSVKTAPKYFDTLKELTKCGQPIFGSLTISTSTPSDDHNVRGY